MGFLGFLGGLLGIGGGPSRKIEVSKASAASGLQIIYGHRRVEPVTVFKVVSKNEMKISITGAYDHYQAPLSTKGEKSDGTRDNNDWLHRVDVWGQGPIESIQRFWLDGDISNGNRYRERAYFRAASKYGSDTQGAASELAAGHAEWNSTHQGKGVAYTWGRYLNDNKKPEFNSEPELNALVKGLRVYDPRKDSTEGGAGTQLFSDPGTWVYSNNRALVVLNYMMGSFGFNAAKSELDLASFSAAADQCDETISIPAPAFNTSGAVITNRYNHIFGTFPSIAAGEYFARWAEDEIETILNQVSSWTHPKYLANAVIDPKTGVVSNMKKLLEGMGWALPWSNGKHKLIIEGPVLGPVMTFDEDSILGGWTIERGMRSERLNRVTVEFPNGNKDYEKDTVSWPSLNGTDHSAYLAEDNGQALHTNVSLETVTNFYAAQAYAEYLVRKSRIDIKITGLKLAPKAMLLEPGDVIALTYPEKDFSNTQFIVDKVNASAFLDVSVDLILYDPTVYGAPALDEEPVAGSPYTPEIWQDATAVANLQLAAVYDTNADGSVISSLRVSWDDPLQAVGIASYEVRWKKTADVEFENAITLTGNSLSAVIPGLVNDTDYTVEVDYTTRKGQTADPATKSVLLPAIAATTANDQFSPATTWDFGGTAAGWVASNATLSVSPYGLTVTPITADHQLLSPDNLNIDGARNGTVLMRIKRVSGDTLQRENIKLYFQTVADATWSEEKAILLSRRLNTGAWTTVAFDLTATSNWTGSTIKQIRLDLTEQSDDVFEVDWVSVGRSAVSELTNNVNLLDRLGHVVIGLADQNLDGQFDDIDLDEMGLKAGDVVSASIEVAAGGARGGKLSIYFAGDGGATPGSEQYYAPNWISNSSLQYVTSKIENIVIPAVAEGVTITKIRLRLSRQDGQSGIVGARRPMLNRGPTVEPWNITRGDVAEGATNNTGVLADLNEVTNAEMALLSATWKVGGTPGSQNIINGAIGSLSALLLRDFAVGGEIQLLWNPVAKTNVGTSEQINVKFFREDVPGTGPRIEIESFTFYLSNERKNTPFVLFWQPASAAEAQNTFALGIELSIVDGVGDVTFEPSRFSISEDTA